MVAFVVLLVIVLCFEILTVVLSIIKRKRARSMKYEVLVKRSKELIDKGQFENLRSFLMSHPRLMLLHWDELTATLSDYAREMDSGSEIKNK